MPTELFIQEVYTYLYEPGLLNKCQTVDEREKAPGEVFEGLRDLLENNQQIVEAFEELLEVIKNPQMMTDMPETYDYPSAEETDSVYTDVISNVGQKFRELFKTHADNPDSSLLMKYYTEV